jgi:hypothetical protein
MRVNMLSWVLYIVGFLLVFGSRMHLVPVGLGWLGWLIALGGWAIGAAPSRHRRQISRSRTDKIAKLNLLRKKGGMTEGEFRKEKLRILREP